MLQESLLAHLAPLLTNQIENVATDALAHLLFQYPVLYDEFRKHISIAGIDLPDNLTIKTQVSWQDAAIPDLVGFDKDGEHLLIVESKFWAKLTPNQPSTYIERLPSDKPAILLFIAPASRMPTLWQELLGRITTIYTDALNPKTSEKQFFTLHLNNRHLLALTSWETLLTRFFNKAQQVKDEYASADIWQMQSLCARINGQIIHLPGPIEERVKLFKGLIDDILTRLVSDGLASIENYNAVTGPDYYRRYMTIKGITNLRVEYNETYRKKFPPTNLFLIAEISRLPGLLNEHAPASFRSGNLILIPLDYPANAHREVVLESLIRQIEDVAKKFTDH